MLVCVCDSYVRVQLKDVGASNNCKPAVTHSHLPVFTHKREHRVIQIQPPSCISLILFIVPSNLQHMKLAYIVSSLYPLPLNCLP